MPLFEAVVNSIHSISEVSADPAYGEIVIEVLRLPQSSFLLDEEGKTKRGAPPQEHILGFRVTDNGAGFHAENMASFETLDSEHKAQQGCRGVGRLLWLKTFEAVNIVSYFSDGAGRKKRTFTFTAAQGVSNISVADVQSNIPLTTTISLSGFNKIYREKSPKTARKIANDLFEHCLWYFVREGGAAKIRIVDDTEIIDLDDIYAEYMFSSSKKEEISIKGEFFELTHLKLKPSSAKQHFVAWCAAGRVVEEEGLIGKVAGLHGRIKDDGGDFVYACYVTSPFLDQHVRPERIGFDIEEINDDLFASTDLSLEDIRRGIVAASSSHLKGYLQENQKAGRERVERFVSQRAPRYRPILGRIPVDKLSVDPEISDKDLDLLLHKQLSEIESSLLAEGHEVMDFDKNESVAQYQVRLGRYLAKADDIKKSDLANYVFHRKVILDIFEKAIERRGDGKYAREDLIHELIMPLRKSSSEVFADSCNLWLIDERLAFHNYLASDKTLSSMPITGCEENKEPDICALNVFDEPILVAEGQRVPLASIVIVEVKRPMRDDAASGVERDPVEQALSYLEKIREGGAKTAAGRPIPASQEIPGFCYAICDLTPTIIRRCKHLGLTPTSDHLGYFGYNANYKAYIEVISFDRLLNAARERNRAFFDKLGLPT